MSRSLNYVMLWFNDNRHQLFISMHPTPNIPITEVEGNTFVTFVDFPEIWFKFALNLDGILAAVAYLELYQSI